MQGAWRHIARVGSWVLLAAALVWSLWFVFAGMGNHQDPLYWLNKYHDLRGGWMVVGTILTGGAWVRWFGAELLPLRLLAWACVVTAIALPYGCLLTREERRNHIHWLAVAFVLMGYGAFQEFSPGTLTVLLLSVLWVLCAKNNYQLSTVNSQLSTVNSPISNLQSPISNPQSPISNSLPLWGSWWGLLSAIVLGLAVAVRFPNILALLVLLPLWRKRSLWCVPVALVTYGAVQLLGYWFVTPAYMPSGMGSHGLSRMVGMLWEKGALLMGYVVAWIGLLMAGKAISRVLPERWSRVGMVGCGIVAGALLVYYVTYVPSPRQWYNIDLTYMVSALCLVMGVAGGFPAFQSLFLQRSEASGLSAKRSFRPQAGLVAGTLLLLVATLGTDTAWLKLFPVVLCLLPVAGVRLSPQMRRYVWPALMAFAIVVAARMTTNSIGKCDLRNANTVATVSPYKGIRVQANENAWMEQLKADCDSLTSNPIIAVGREMHLMQAVGGCEAGVYNEFWSNIFDSVYTAKYRPEIGSRQPIVICSYTPQFKTKPQYRDRHSAFEEMLREEGYSERDRRRYVIYLPPETECK